MMMTVTIVVAMVVPGGGERRAGNHCKKQYSNEFLHEKNLARIAAGKEQNSQVNLAF